MRLLPGLFAAAGIFLIAACFVGIMALFRWVEIKYGQFWAFGAVGALLLAIAALCAGLAATKLQPPATAIPLADQSLARRCRGQSSRSGQIDDAKDTAASVSAARSARATYAPRTHNAPPRGLRVDRNVQAGLAVAGLLLGWAVARRRQQARRTEI